jgi:GTP-binding protein
MPTPAKVIDHRLPTVALIGRVNVGKSSLFNKILEQNLALVSTIAGTTRTRNIGVASWRGRQFRVIDTGGLTFSEDVPLEDDIIKQTEIALAEADIIVFVTNIREGLLPQEKEIAKRLLKVHKQKPVFLVANKADSKSTHHLVHEREWLSLGFGAPFPVSAANGSNVGDLLDAIYKQLGKLKKAPKEKLDIQPIKVALMGKPNVGKSSLFNKLIGEERVIVSDMAHTTREPHDTLVEIETDPSEVMEGEKEAVTTKKKAKTPKDHILFIDTAGIRRKSKVSGELERFGIQKSIATINRADIVLLVLDATEPITDQDQQLAGLLREHTRSVIIVINKWDRADDNDDMFRNEVKKDIYKKFSHLIFAPIVFVSAKTGYRVHQIFPLIKRAWLERHTQIDDKILEDFLQHATKRHKPVTGLGVRHPKLLGFHQIATNPPIFELFIKAKTSLHMSYVRYLENRLREQFSFFATPIIIKLTKFKK